MVVSVKCFYGTGLTPGNVLDNKSILNSAGVQARTFSDVAVKQTRLLDRIRIAGTWATVEDLDYCQIGEDCYWVTNIEMINDNVAELQLSYDAITSVGLNNISVISGWCTRRCVTDDTLFANVIPEPFTPQQEFKIDFGSRILPNENYGSNSFVVLTCGLYDNNVQDGIQAGTLYRVDANVIDQIGEFLGVVVPEVPELDIFTQFTMNLDEDAELINKTISSPMTCVFNLSNPKVQYTISKLNALGLNNAIVYAYSVPKCYCSDSNITYADNSNDQISGMVSNTTAVQSSLQVEFGEYKNKKVYSGQFYNITLLSMSSGDSVTFEVEDIIETGSSQGIFYEISSDLQYIGYPFIYPLVYKNSKNSKLLGCVNGSQWLQAPIKEVGNEGWYWAQANKNLKAFTSVLSSIPSISALNSMAPDRVISGPSFMKEVPTHVVKGGDMSGVSQIGNPIGEISDAVLYSTGYGNVESSNVSVKFSQLYTLQNYFGNSFFDYRTRLSDYDMQRFDRFLTMFGYAVSEPLTTDCFKGRQYFNYVQANAVNIKTAGFPLYVRRMITSAVTEGVRIWHVMPNESAFNDNPISEG